MMTRPALLTALMLLAVLSTEAPVAQAWSETTSVLTQPYIAWAPHGAFFVDKIAIRAGQQDLYFYSAGQEFIRMEVCVITTSIQCADGSYGPEWQVIYNGSRRSNAVRWAAAPQSVGESSIRMRYYRLAGGIEPFDFKLIVMPPAQRAFSDTEGNSVVMWQGTTAAVDSPLLLVEGIDGKNVTTPAHYYSAGRAG